MFLALFVAGCVGALASLAVGFIARRIVGPWIAKPIADHVREELTDLVAVIVLSPEIQADLRATMEEVMAAESAVMLREFHGLSVQVHGLSGRVERLETAVHSLPGGRDAVT